MVHFMLKIKIKLIYSLNFKNRPHINRIQDAFNFHPKLDLDKAVSTAGLAQGQKTLSINLINSKKTFFKRSPFKYILEAHYVQN
jgi:hypothetical protein